MVKTLAFSDLRAELLKDEATKAAYDALASEFEVARQIIAERMSNAHAAGSNSSTSAIQ
jgi:hypothetical protein